MDGGLIVHIYSARAWDAYAHVGISNIAKIKGRDSARWTVWIVGSTFLCFSVPDAFFPPVWTHMLEETLVPRFFFHHTLFRWHMRGGKWNRRKISTIWKIVDFSIVHRDSFFRAYDLVRLSYIIDVLYRNVLCSFILLQTSRCRERAVKIASARESPHISSDRLAHADGITSHKKFHIHHRYKEKPQNFPRNYQVRGHSRQNPHPQQRMTREWKIVRGSSTSQICGKVYIENEHKIETPRPTTINETDSDTHTGNPPKYVWTNIFFLSIIPRRGNLNTLHSWTMNARRLVTNYG